jgi:hypothetical protein
MMIPHQSLKDFPYKVRQNAHGLREKRTSLAGVVPEADPAKAAGPALGTGLCHLYTSPFRFSMIFPTIERDPGWKT